MKVGRVIRHLFATHWGTHRRFTPAVLAAIEASVSQVETQHAGEIRFVIETALHPALLWHDLAPRQRALQLFSQLRVWDTAQNNGVLIYVLLADRDVEILADRGLAARVPQAEWDEVCREMERHFRSGDFGRASVAGVQHVGRLLARHFPSAGGAGANELPNQPVLL
jgi:uncharacterized membrane protein